MSVPRTLGLTLTRLSGSGALLRGLRASSKCWGVLKHGTSVGNAMTSLSLVLAGLDVTVTLGADVPWAGHCYW